ncbi:PilZ domain-containing protein [Marinobacter fuscus]|uniref:PilZ domain-containing protein n=1 Tax=Marinobacter fuscus TaxID=2109942 RepID=A0A2T1K5R0_9GAMM|nr:PilZ domain-containing protein [Marinobacter fuscus]PSF05400.1 PilZ domain-containing protein [Marinobacter fuscus]
MKDYSEKRDFHRMQVNSSITVTGPDGQSHAGVCKDLSAAGMLVTIGSAFEVGDELKARIEGNGDQFPALETLCEVVRCEPDGDRYLLGINIIEVTQ